jgi:formylglycine-generating enzyme required for sulfatase activity
VQVSWNDAVAYCEWLNKKDAKKPAGMEYGLPTEAQWEYACRAGTTKAYFFGDDPKDLGDFAWYDGNSGNHTHAVGTTPKANSWGLDDMYGNVWQWCADFYDAGYYKNSPIKDPENTNTSNSRVLRGGSWDNSAIHCRSAIRYFNDPGHRSDGYGFRVALRPGVRTP